MKGDTVRVRTCILARDMVEYDRFLRKHGLENYHLLSTGNEINLSIEFTVRGELMIYRLKNLEHAFCELHSETYMFRFVEVWAWEEIFQDEWGEFDR